MNFTDDCFIKVILQSIEGEKEDLIINKKDLKKNVTKAGDNYASEIVQLDVEYTKSGNRKTQNFIIKKFSSVPTYKIGKSMGFYDKEVEMYKSVLPAMAELLDKEENLIFPKIFDSNYPDILVLEDLKPLGYVMMDRIKQLDFEYASVAFRTLAKFHALSIRLNEKSPNIIEKVSTDLYFATETGIKMLSDMYENSFNSILKELKKVKEAERYVDSFFGLKSQILNKAKELLTLKKSKIQLLNHGDHWINNLMFRHDEEGNVIDSKLLDFQFSRWCSPAIDIWYFVVTSVAFPVFQLHFDSFIAIYVTSLNQMLENTGSKVRYSFKEIEKELDECVAFGMFIMVAFLNGILSDPSDPVDMEKLLESTNNLNMDTLTKTYRNKNYLKVLGNWFLYFNRRIEEEGIDLITET